MCSVTQLLSRVLFCDRMASSLPGSSVHGIFPARILEWIAIYFSRGSSRPKDWTRVSCIACIAGIFFTNEPLGNLFKKWSTWKKIFFFKVNTETSMTQELLGATSKKPLKTIYLEKKHRPQESTFLATEGVRQSITFPSFLFYTHTNKMINLQF